jgi:hypothetical protein
MLTFFTNLLFAFIRGKRIYGYPLTFSLARHTGS